MLATIKKKWKALRLSDTWQYKVPTLISIPYFFVLYGRLPLNQAAVSILLSFTTIIGIAGFGYWLNDLTDIEEDRKKGKKNIIAQLNVLQRIGLLTLFLCLAFLPWLYLPLSQCAAYLLAAQFLVFILYSVPPLRFKERHLLGVLCDAAYAHIIPSALAAITFIAIIGKKPNNFSFYLITLIGWQTIVGIRNILIHQLKDAQSDLAVGTKTLGTIFFNKGVDIRKIGFILFYLELIIFAALIISISQYFNYFLVGYSLFILFKLKRDWPLLKQKNEAFEEKFYRFLDDFYINWLAICLVLFFPSETKSDRYLQIGLLLSYRFLLPNQLRQTWRWLLGTIKNAFWWSVDKLLITLGKR